MVQNFNEPCKIFINCSSKTTKALAKSFQVIVGLGTGIYLRAYTLTRMFIEAELTTISVLYASNFNSYVLISRF